MKTFIEGQSIGDLFSQTVIDIKRGVPPNTTGSVDLKIEFKDVKLEEAGVRFIWNNTTSKTSSLEITIATKIYTDDNVRSLDVEIVLIIQGYLKARLPASYVIKEIPGQADQAILKNAFDSALGPILATRVKNTYEEKLVAVFQMLLNEAGASPALEVDGEWGNKTLTAYYQNRNLLLNTYTK